MRVNAYGERVDGPTDWRFELAMRLADEGRALRYCDVCGRPMLATGQGGARKYCSWDCRREAGRYQARMRKRRIAKERCGR